MEHKITHRAARKEDAPLIAKAVAMAFGDECVKALCGDDYLNVLEDIAKSEDSQYSFKNAIIAEVDGLPAGAICGYDGSELSKLKARTLERTHRTRSPSRKRNPGRRILHRLPGNTS